MLRIGVLAGGTSRTELSQQLSPLGRIDWCERPDALLGRAIDGGLDAVVTGVEERSGGSVAPVIVDLAAYRPTLPVVVYARINRATLDHLLAVCALGLRLECAARPFARLAPLLQYMRSSAYRPGVVPLLLHHVMPLVPSTLRTFVALGILSAPARRGVEDVARWSGVSPRTVERWLQQAGWPAARVVLRSFSALDAVWLMTEYGWAARRVQLIRHFAHPSGVTRLLARYAGTRPGTVVLDGGFPTALEHVLHVLVPRANRSGLAEAGLSR
ncbi:MAG: hypothetical protein ACJ8AD_20465 [Gemmatimonadaceae bacterium]